MSEDHPTDERTDEDVNPERQGPDGSKHPPPSDDRQPDPAAGEPPPEAIPGDSGEVPNPQQR